ncbi:MAG: FAD:protein FMN transferase [Candidatus Hydrogenedentes bacterium]|nr:FAD:protein FMN transferase [Candidatus Hydrogenedentota bacterium]
MRSPATRQVTRRAAPHRTGGAIGVFIAFLCCATLPNAFAEQVPKPSPAEFVAQKFTHQAMSTEFEITLYVPKGDPLTNNLKYIADEAFDAVDDLETRLSNWRPSSQVSTINADAGKEPTRAAADIVDLVTYSKDLWRESDGAFDVTVGPLLKLYGLYRKQGKLPSDKELLDARAKVGMDKVVIDHAEGTVFLQKPGMLLDFGGIGKGLALDEAAAVLKKNGISIALLNGGASSILAMGAPPNEKGWTVNIRHPYRDSDTIDHVMIANEALSTSGCYGSQLEAGGKTICHIFDPRTGTPITGMLTAAVIIKSSDRPGTMSDALTKPIMINGPEWTRRYCKTHPNVSAIVVPVPQAGEPKPEHINIP